MKFLKFFFDRNGNKNKGDFLIRFQLSLFQFYSSYVRYDSIYNFPKLNWIKFSKNL